jgi:hypothetical protein
MRTSVEYPLGKGKAVKVRGRGDEGVVVDVGKNIGEMYCVGIHFPSTGEVVYYEQRSVVPARDSAPG